MINQMITVVMGKRYQFRWDGKQLLYKEPSPLEPFRPAESHNKKERAIFNAVAYQLQNGRRMIQQ